MDWQAITLEETETESVLCDCCRMTTTIANGDLSLGEAFIGWYSVRFSKNSSDHQPIISIYVGDWSEGAAKDTRWGMRVLWHPEGCELLDWQSNELEQIATYTPLGRGAILGTPYAEEMWAKIDAIIMKDSRLKELHES